MAADRRALRALRTFGRAGHAGCALALVLLSACGPTTARHSMGTGEARSVAELEEDGLRVQLLPYTAAMESRSFGIDLHREQTMAVELKLSRAAGDASTLKIRRTGIRGRFADGTVRDAMDARKLTERTRTGTTGAIIATAVVGGVVGAALPLVIASTQLAMDADVRKSRLYESSVLTLAQLDEQHPDAFGFVFFDLEGLPDRRLVAVDIEFENTTASRLDEMTVRLP